MIWDFGIICLFLPLWTKKTTEKQLKCLSMMQRLHLIYFHGSNETFVVRTVKKGRRDSCPAVLLCIENMFF